MLQVTEERIVLRGLDVSGLQHHLDLVLGAGEQLDGSGLAEPGSVHLVEHGPLVGLDPKRDGDGDDVRDVVHDAGLRAGGWAAAEEDHRQAGRCAGFRLFLGSFEIRAPMLACDSSSTVNYICF